MTSATLPTAQRLILPRSGGEALLLSLVIIALPFFFITGPGWLTTNLGKYLGNLGHIPFFALLTLLASSRLPLDRPRRWFLFSAAVLFVSLVMEFVQSRIGRSADWQDVLRNLVGSWLVLFWLQKPCIRIWSGRLATGSFVLAEVVLSLALALEQQQLEARLPTLADFENVSEEKRWEPIAGTVMQSEENASHGKFSLKGLLKAAPFSGISLSRLPHDWSAYNSLNFDLYNPQPKPLYMTLRIHDAGHELGDRRWQYYDRFNRRLKLQSGWNYYRIDLQTLRNAPESREMDLRFVENLSLFAAGLSEPKVIYADNFRLEM